MSEERLIDKFTDREIISFTNLVRRIPQGIVHPEALLDIPRYFTADEFIVFKWNTQITLRPYENSYSSCFLVYIDFTEDGNGIERIVIRPENLQL